MKDYYYIKNQKEGTNLIKDDYIYNKDKEEIIGIRWRCQHRTCIGSVYIFKEGQPKIIREHNHSAEKAKIEKINTLNKIKSKSLETKNTGQDIISSITSSLTDELITMMPKHSSLIDKITKYRNKKLVDFKSVHMDIPDKYKYNLRNELFIQYDSGVTDDERFIIFFLILARIS